MINTNFQRILRAVMVAWLLLSASAFAEEKKGTQAIDERNTMLGGPRAPRAPDAEQTIVFADGTRMAVRSYEVKGGILQFTTLEGKLRSIPRSYVNLMATDGANRGAAAASPVSAARSTQPPAAEREPVPIDSVMPEPPIVEPALALAPVAPPALPVSERDLPVNGVIRGDDNGNATFGAARLDGPLMLDGEPPSAPRPYVNLVATEEANGGTASVSPVLATNSALPPAAEREPLPMDSLMPERPIADPAPDSESVSPPAPQVPAVITRDDNGKATLRAVRLDEPLVIDGTLDERPYATVPSISGFVQQEPHAGEPATEQTEVWIFFDQSNIYISARLWDSHPERIVANEMRRDNRSIQWNNASFSVILDTFYDHRNGFYFLTNPLGALWDAQVTDEQNINGDWNTIWYVKSGRFAEGWTVEMSLPFKSLRYGAGTSQIWGINFERRVKWKNERSHLAPIPAAFDRNGLLKLSFAATLVGIEIPGSSMNLEVKPYVTGDLSTDQTADVPYENQGDANFGVDAKYGVTKGLTFDFTYNTDFAQVEADEAQVNLTRFSLFFPEKREFFLEGQGIFNFGGRDARAFGFDGPSDMPVMFFSRRIGLEGGDEIPILAGGRLTGRAGAFSLGFLNITTEDLPAGGVPQTNYSVVRVKRDILARSNIGFIGTYRNENLDGNGGNGLFGADGNFTFYENLNVNAYYAKTETPELGRGDTSYRGGVKYDADLYGFEAEHMLVDPDFNPEVGFLLRENFRKTSAGARYSIRPRGIDAIRKLDFEGRYKYFETVLGSELETELFEVESRARLESGDFINVTYNHNLEALFDEFEITDGIFIPVGTYEFDRVRAGIFTSGHRRISGWVGAETGSFFGGTRTEATYRGRVEVTPQFSLEPDISINWIDLPWGSFTTNLVRIRGTYTVSPRSFVGALVQYNSEANDFTTNIRFRWEYQPGSDIFFVYSDGRNTLSGASPTLENRSFVVKVTRLFRF